MGNFERLSVLVIVVVIVMILIVALVHLTNDPADPSKETANAALDAPAAPQAPSGTSNGVSLPNSPVSGRGTTASATTTHGAPPSAPARAPDLNSIFERSGGGLVNANGTVPPGGSTTTDAKPEGDAAKPEPAKAPEPKIYVIQPGDTLGKIAKRELPTLPTGKGVEELTKANPGVDSTHLRVGYKLTIPGMAAGDSGTSSSSSEHADTRRAAIAPSGGISPGGSYVVRAGDTLASISRRAYGNTERWHEIWLANYAAVGDDVDHPRPNTRLSIPR